MDYKIGDHIKIEKLKDSYMIVDYYGNDEINRLRNHYLCRSTKDIYSFLILVVSEKEIEGLCPIFLLKKRLGL